MGVRRSSSSIDKCEIDDWEVLSFGVADEQDARRPSRRSSSRFSSLTPTMQAVQNTWKGPDKCTEQASGFLLSTSY